MTSEAVDDEPHASDPSFLSSQNTRLGKEAMHPPTPFPETKQIRQSLNKHPAVQKSTEILKIKQKSQEKRN